MNVTKPKFARRCVAALTACAAGLACLLSTPVAAATEAAPALVLTPSEVTLNEGHWNWKRNYTLRLATRPSGEVKVRVQGKRGVDLRSEDGGQEPPYTNPWKPNLVFTFTPDNWNRPKTLRAIAESDPDGTDETVTLTHRASGADYDSVIGDVVVKVIDDDPELLDFSPSSASVREGSSSDYHMRLNTWPNGTLTVTVSGASNGVTFDTDSQTAGNQNTLTFNNRNWGQWQAVSLFAADDANRVDETVTLRHSVSGGTVPVNEPVKGLTVNVRDDDKPAFRLSRPSALAGGGVIVTSSYQVRLATQPSADVTMTIAPSTPSEKVKVDTERRTRGYQNTLVFTPSNWDTARWVTVTITKDNSGTRGYVQLDHTAVGGGYDSTTADTRLYVVNNALPAFLFSPSSLALTEGSSNSYRLRMEAQPSSDVTVTLSVTGPSNGVIFDTDSNTVGNQNTLTFTTENWNALQTVTVTAAEDANQDEDWVVLTHRASGGGYDARPVVKNLDVRVADNDIQALWVGPESLTIRQGSWASYGMRLATRPAGDVTVRVTGATDGVSVTPPTLTFRPSTWNTYQHVTVSAVEESNGVDETVTLTNTASGGGYDHASAKRVVVTVDDDQKPTLRISRKTIAMDEGSQTTYKVRFVQRPSRDREVVVDWDTDRIQVKPNRLTFTTDNWNRDQTVTVTAHDYPNDMEGVLERIAHIIEFEEHQEDDQYILVNVLGGGTPPSRPIALSLAPGNASLTARWSAPTANGGSAITDYDVRYRPTDASLGGGWTELDDSTWNTATTATITGLTNDARYEVQVRAQSVDGAGDWSESVAAVPVAPTGPPTAATNLVVAPGDNSGELLVRWTAASHAPNGYSVRWRGQDAHPGALTSRNEVSGTSFTIANLTDGTTYFVRVDTYNLAGDGIQSGTKVTGTGTPRAPNQPPTLQAFNDQVADPGRTLNLDVRVADTDAADRLRFKASSSDATKVTVTPTELTDYATDPLSQVSLTLVDPGTASVTVTVSDGTAEVTDTFVVTVAKRVLATPSVSVQAEDGQLQATWAAVTGASSYEVEYREADATTWIDNSDDTSPALIANLTNGREYEVQVRAKAASGSTSYVDSPWSTLTKGTPVEAVEADVAPSFASGASIPKQTWTVGTAVNLTLPAATGGNGALSYALTPDLPAGVTLDASTRALSGAPTAVADETTYTWRAADGDGNAEDSDTATLTFKLRVNKGTLATPSVQLAVGDGQLTATWGNVANAGSYVLQWKEATVTGWNAQTGVNTVDPATSGQVLSGLKNGAAHDVRVKAKAGASSANHVDSAWSETAKGTPAEADVAPSFADGASIPNQAWTVGTAVNLTLPAATGGNGTLSYALTPDLPAGVTLDASTRTLTGAPTAMANATSYIWRVADGDGNAEKIDTAALTFAVTVSKGTLATPSVSVSAQDGQLQATWAPVTGASSYEVVYREADATTWIDNSDDTSPALITGLTNGQEYEVQVRAKPASGSTIYADSNWSQTAKGTPTAADVAPSFASGESIPKQTWTVGTAVNLTLPAATGGNGTLSYTLTPDLPAGVTLDASTRVLSGAPTAVASETTYTWRAADGDSNSEDSDTATLSFKVEVNKGALSAPSVQLAAGDAQLTATWGNVANAGSYVLQWKEATVTGWDASTGVNTVDPATSGQVISGLKNGAAHDVRVKAKAGPSSANHVDSDWSETAKGTPVEADVAPSFASGASIPNQTWTVGTSVNLTLPAATGGNGAVSYALTPDLPAGVTLDTSTRTLSGAPTTVANAATYTWRVADGDGNAEEIDTAALTFTVTVTKPALASPSNLRLSVASLGPDGFTIYWNRVPNASGYVVTATAAGVPAATAEAWDTETGKEALFTGLTAGTAYEVSVTATGDENYADSAPATISVTTQAQDQPQGQAPSLSYSPPPTKLTVGTTIETMRANPDNFESVPEAPSQAYFLPFSQSFQQPLAPTPIDPTSDDEEEQEPAPFAYEPHLGFKPPPTPTPIDGGPQLDDGLSYSVNPDLPPGLQLDQDTGEISGTPSEANDSPTQVIVTATSGAGANAPTASTSITFPPVGAAALASPTSLELKPDTLTTTTFAVQWAAVPNASGYRATATTSGGTPVSGEVTGTEASFLGLASGTDYQVSVTATGNANHKDSPAATLTVTTATPSGPPTAVSEVSVQPGDNSGELRVSWKAASHAPNGYSVRWREQAAHPRTLTSRNEVSGTSFTISGLADGTLYFVRVDTYNEAGDGIERGTKVTGSGTPRAPEVSNQIPTLQSFNDYVADPGVTRNFDVRAADADAGDALRYKASSSDDTKVTVTPTEFTDYATSPLSQVSLTLVDPGTASVTVTVSDGTAEVTDTFVVTVGKHVLTAPSVSVAAQDGQLQATWAAVTNADSYEVEYRKTGETTWIDSSDDTSPALIAGLTNDQEYEVQVRAKAASGSASHVDSRWSETAKGTPVEGDVAPSFPAGTVTQHQTWTVGTAVNLTLPAATDGTGNGALSYTLTPDLPAGVTLDASTRTLSGAPTAVASTSHYTWRVADSDGNVADSDTAALTFAVTVNKGTLATPTNLRVKAGSLTRTGFRLTWDAVANASDYVATATAYEKTVNAAVTGAEAEFTGLTMNIAYDVAVKAVGNAIYADSAAQTMSVTTAANESPFMDGIDDREGGVGTTLTLDVNAWDTESDPLRYEAYSSDETKVTVTPTEFTDYSASPASQVTLTLVGVGRTDVTVTVSDGMAQTASSFYVQVNEAASQAPPVSSGPPTAATGVSVEPGDNSGELAVSWAAASHAPNGYSVRWREKGPGKSLSAINSVAGTSFTISGLTDGTAYIVRVDTYNAAGDGLEHGTKAVGSGTPRTPDAPQAATNRSPTITAINDQSATFGANLAVDVDASDADGDDLRYKASSDNAAVATVTPVALTEHGSNSQVTVTPVGAGTTTIRVTLSDGELEASETFNVTVSLAALASPSPSLEAGDGQLTATWTDVNNAASYQVQYRESGSDTWTDSSDNTSPAVIESLANGTEHEVRVRAKAAAGSTTHADGAWSTTVKDTPVEADVAPSFAAGATVPNQTWRVGETVNLALPEATGGNGTLSYALTPDLPMGLSLDSTTNTLSGAPTAVADAATYTWRVSDSDGNSEDADSATLTFSVTIGKGALQTPANLALKADTLTATSFTVSWDAVANASRYTATATASGTTVTGAVTGTEASFTGLEESSDYSVSVTATGNASYEDSAAQSLSVTTLTPVSGPPTAVTGLSAVAGDAPDKLVVTWTAASHAPHGYSLRWRKTAGGSFAPTQVISSGQTTTYTITGLESGIRYRVRIDSRNEDGSRASGTAVSMDGTTHSGQPTAVTGLSVSPGDDAGELVATWTAASYAPHGYNLRWRKTNGGKFAPVQVIPSGRTTYTITGLESGTRYRVRLDSRNTDGTRVSGTAVSKDGTPLPSLSPPVVRLEARDSGRIGVVWDAVENAADYELDYRAQPTEPTQWTVDADRLHVVAGRSFDLSELVSGQAYEVRVRARPAADSVDYTRSPWSDVKTAVSEMAALSPTAGYASDPLPTIRIDDAQGDEGDTLDFRITLSPAVDHEVTVRWRTESGTAQAGQDFESGGSVVTFGPDEVRKTVQVRTLDDAHDDPGETFRVVLSNARRASIGDGEAVGTIRNSDPLPRAWLGHFGRTVAEQALDGIANRIAATRIPGTQVTLAGQPIEGSGLSEGSGHFSAGYPDAFGSIRSHGFDIHRNEWLHHDEHSMTGREALMASRFTLTGVPVPDGSGGNVAFWGRGAQSSFDGEEETTRLDGAVTTATLGIDYAEDRWLAGLAIALSDGEGGYRQSDTGSGRLETSLSAAIPYASLKVSERLGVWGAAGYGIGTVTLTPEGRSGSGADIETDIDWGLAAAGVRNELSAPPTHAGPALTLVSDVLWTRTTSERVAALAASESEATRLRLGLEASWSLAQSDGGGLTPRLEAGVRHDDGDAGTGVGVELGGGLTWTVPRLGLSLDLAGRTLLDHEADGRDGHGFSAALGYDASPGSARGLSLSLRQETGGRSDGGLEALFAPEPLDGRIGIDSDSRWTAEAAYGLPVFGGRFTGSPTVGFGHSGTVRDYSFGWRLAPTADAPSLSLGLMAARRESRDAAPEHRIGFELRARW